MEVPFRLTCRDEPDAVDAFLLFAEDATPLVAACVRLGRDLVPTVFAVRGGFVLVPANGQQLQPFPGAIRLRRVAGDLFIPADANLVPALLTDEAVTLTQNRGLVMLPGGDVLAFAPTPLPIEKWLAPIRVRREEWEPFPARPDHPDTLTVIERPAPPAAIMDVLGGGAPDDAEPLAGEGAGSSVPEDARPPSGSTFRRFVAGTGLAIGGILTWFGKQLGSVGLAKLGGDMARKALEAVPRLSERVLGEQEAALREVLRQLQSGDVEKGLRRAPIAVGDPDQPGRVGTDAQLGNRDPRYSLRDLIGSGGGTATAWLGGGDVWDQLARTYRQLAEEAMKRGDFRRAAYLYGVLLRDLRSAANALMAGGLYRDAALLFRDKLNEPLPAANAFERAGDHDEALRLYEKYGNYEKAAELLMRLGDEDRAIAYYIRAADDLASRGHYLGAGELVRNKAGRRDLAIGYFRQGWKGITAENVVCGERLLDEHLVAEDLPAVNALFTEAEANLAERANDCGRFFNYALRVGEDFLPAETRDDLADRVRLMFAAHLRATGSPPEGVRLASELFGQNHPWPGPVVRDATLAAREKATQPVLAGPAHSPPVKLADGTVTAVVVARGTFDIVVATTEAVVLWRVRENRVVPVSGPHSGRVAALSVSPTGDIVYLFHKGDVRARLQCFTADRADSFSRQRALSYALDAETEASYLQPSASFHDNDHQVTVATPGERRTFIGPHLRSSSEESTATDVFETFLLVESQEGRMWDWNSWFVRWWKRASENTNDLICQWSPTSWQPKRGTVDWIASVAHLEVTSIDRESNIRWATFDATDPESPRSRSACSTQSEYVAACLTGPGAVAAVTSLNEVQWLRVAGQSLEVVARVSLDLPTAVVALVARPTQNEVVAILADGYAVRLTRP
ncbi:MAG: hypothetical protein C0467_06795 [Planctomycetaceae bacterium]|nr:hypothetical protein [Planctomycetaceae bacterium]